MTWVITANTNTCYIYEYNIAPVGIAFIKELNHPSSRLRESELVADRPGSYRTNSTAIGKYTPKNDHQTIEIENFAQEIAEALNQARKKNKYKDLILIAPPQMNGLIQKCLDGNVKSCIEKTINKDYMRLAEDDLVKILWGGDVSNSMKLN